MAHLITATNGTGSTAPLAVSNYAFQIESRSIFHDTLDGGQGFSYVPPRPGSSRLTLVYSDRAQAFAALALHKLSPMFTWVSDDTPETGMTYAIDGTVSITADGTLWSVQVDARVIV